MQEYTPEQLKIIEKMKARKAKEVIVEDPAENMTCEGCA